MIISCIFDEICLWLLWLCLTCLWLIFRVKASKYSPPGGMTIDKGQGFLFIQIRWLEFLGLSFSWDACVCFLGDFLTFYKLVNHY